MSEIKGYSLTDEEEKMCLELIKEKRMKESHEKVVKYYKKQIKDLIPEMINEIGLDDTKRVIREIKQKVEKIRITGNGKILLEMEEEK